MRTAMACLMALGLLSAWGCSSSKAHDPAMMAMHCSKCNMDMKSDLTLKCKCSNDVQVGDLKVECPKCHVEVRMADCADACAKCGAAMTQATCKVKCPKCGGTADAKDMQCPHCMGTPKK